MKFLSSRYSVKRAWILAILYVAMLIGLSFITGVPQKLVENKQIIREFTQKGFEYWITLLISLAISSYAYGIYWCKHTLRFGRRLYPFWQSLFGATWGLATGLWMLGIVNIAGLISNSQPIILYFVSFIAISLWQALAQSHFWGVYISPEHDTEYSNRQKVWRAHVPHLACSLVLPVFFNAQLSFIGLQVLALVLTSIGLRMPVWWDKEKQVPPTLKKGLWGLPRTSGVKISN